MKKKRNEKKDTTYERFTKMVRLTVKMFGNPLTKNDICEILNCSKRTADRVVNCIYDVYSEFGGLEEKEKEGKKAWIISGNQRLLKPLKVDEDDLYLLNTLADLMAKQGRNEDSERLTNLRAQLVQSLSKKDREWEGLVSPEGNVFRPGVKVDIDPEIIKIIRQAIREKKVINIEYFNKNSGKISEGALEPYGILYSDRMQYLLARHWDNYFNDEIHHFILSNIRSAIITKEDFKGVDFDMNDYMKDSFGVWREEPYDVEWKFTAKAAPEAENFIFHPGQETIKNEDGTLTVKFRAGGTLEMAWHLATWGKQVKVVQPADFWQRVKKAEKERWK